MPVRVDFGIAQDRGHAVFETLGDEVFQPFGLLVHFVPGILQNVMQEEFEQAVMADEFPGAAFSGRRESDTLVLLIHNEGGPLR